MKIKDLMKSNMVRTENMPQVNGYLDISDLDESLLRRTGEGAILEEVLEVTDRIGDKIGEIRTEILKFLLDKSEDIKFTTIIDKFNEGVIAVDREGKIFFVNEAYPRLLNVPMRKIVGKNIKTIETNALINQVLHDKRPISRENILINSINKYVTAQIYPLYRNGVFKGAYSIFSDVTELNNLSEEVKRITEVAQEYLARIESKQEAKNLNIISANPRFLNLLSQAVVVAKTDAPVLIRGENGVGKEIFAKLIQKSSSRKDKPFITVNCAAVPENLIESELFGYEEGSFTGAKHGGKIGKFQLAEGGTLFLDEIGDMPYRMQSKLLRVLQEGEIEKIGREKNIPIDVRIIAATNQPLEKMVEEKTFREDLYYRLNVVSLEVPPLRERCEDIVLLANHFLCISSAKYQKNLIITKEVYDCLTHYSWPGNIRELQNCIVHAVILCSGSKIAIENLPDRIRCKVCSDEHKPLYYENGTLKERLQAYEKLVIQGALETTGKNKSKAMEVLGLSRRTFYRKLAEYQLE